MEPYYRIGKDKTEFDISVKYTGEEIMKMDVAEIYHIYKIYIPLIDGKLCGKIMIILYNESFPGTKKYIKVFKFFRI
uniref:Uncharacterized protein n=1 Tax=viral metagenome TaxID=1070528 RepID=A0A6C0EC21_9ZZZZ